MFKKMQNIDLSFRHIRTFTLAFLCCCTVITCFALYKCISLVHTMQDKVYILANGRAIEAFSSGRKDNIPVEARDHIKNFHQYFFSLDPDDKVIQANITKALYLADASAKREYDNLKENGYYANIIAGNISQEITIDSITVDVNQYPYHFRCYATQNIIRTTSTVARSLVTEGVLRNVSRSDNNPHGFLIERWATLENKDIKIQIR